MASTITPETRAAIDRFVDKIASLNVWELAQLIKALEPTFGTVDSGSTVAVQKQETVVTETTKEQSEFDVTLVSYGENKVGVIKVLRELTGLGLREAMDIANAVPKVFKESVAKADAEVLKQKLEAAGAQVTLG